MWRKSGCPSWKFGLHRCFSRVMDWYEHACWPLIADWYWRDQNIMITSYSMRFVLSMASNYHAWCLDGFVDLYCQSRITTNKTRDRVTNMVVTNMVKTEHHCLPKATHVKGNIFRQKFKFWYPYFSSFTSRCYNGLTPLIRRPLPSLVSLVKPLLFYSSSFSRLPALNFVALSKSRHHF